MTRPVSRPTTNSTSFGILTVAVTLIGWSSIPLFLRYFADHVDAWTSNGWRYAFSALLWLPLLIARRYQRRTAEGLWRAALVPSLINAVGQTCFTWAHYRIDPGLLTFGLRSQLVFVAVGAYLLFPIERPVIRSVRYLLGLVAVAVGTAVTIGLGDAFTSAQAEGIVLALCSGGLFAAYGLSVRYFMRGIPPVTAFAAICQYTAAIMLLLMVLLGERAGLGAFDLSGGQFGMLLLSGMIGIAIGHVFYYLSIANLGVAVSTGVIQLQPFLVTVGSLVLFDEFLSFGQWMGGLLAVTGAVLMLWVQHRITQRQLRAADYNQDD